MYFMDLIEFVLAWKKRLFGYQFEENASEAPDIHFLIIVAIGHQALRRPIPSCGDVVSVGGGRVLALAGAKICQFYYVSLDEYVLWLDIPVENALAVHVLDSFQGLEHENLDLLKGEGVFFIFEALVEIHLHELKYQG